MNFPIEDEILIDNEKQIYLDCCYMNIGIVGNVSAGKTTLINTLFGSKLSEMSIQRNTTSIQIYKEIPKIKLRNKIIKEHNIKMNKQGIGKKNVKIAQYYVPSIKDVKKKQISLLKIWDFPGMNDSDFNFKYDKNISELKDINKNKEKRFETCLEKNVNKLDLLFYIIDINLVDRPEEFNTIKYILNLIKKQNLFLVVIVNKVDNLTYNSDSKKPEFNDININLQYKKLKTIIHSESEKLNIKKNILYIIPTSLLNAYIYRLLKLNKNAIEDFDDNHINEFGANEFGKKKWRKLNNDEKKKRL